LSPRSLIQCAVSHEFDKQCPNPEMAERDCVRRTSRSAAAGLRHSRAPAKLGHYRSTSLMDKLLLDGNDAAYEH